MPKVSAEHRRARRDQIARAAVEQFAARGIHSTSMANIVEASGLSAGAIYTHFSGKDEIIAHVARTTVSGVFEGFEGLLDSGRLPAPSELVAMIAESISRTGVPTGFVVQIWAEAVTNPVVRRAANDVYASAFDFFREYSVLWLSTDRGLDVRRARALAPRQARALLSLVYSHILQSSLIDGYETGAFTDDVGALLDTGPGDGPGA